MKKEFVPKKLLYTVLLTLFALLCFLPPALADYRDSVDHHVQCRDKWSKTKDKCNAIFGKSMQKASGSKEETELFDLAVKCHSMADTNLDRCRDPKIVRKFVKNKKWRTEHKDELAALAKEFEKDDDKCTKIGESGVEKCEKVKAKKRGKCLRKESKKFLKCLTKAEKSFLKKLKKLKPPKK